MYKLEFTLKQHTPLIHFQHNQAGATLRATEVKPKLDFFIMKKLLNDPEIPDHKIRDEFEKMALSKNEDGKDHQWKNWLVGKGKNEHVALDYKLLLLSRDERPERCENIKLITDADKSSNESSQITFSLRSLANDLIGEIRKNISEFFTLTNFGNRNNKGFGCFYPEFLDSWDKVKKELIKSDLIIFVSKEELRPVLLQCKTKDNVTTFPFYDVVSKKWRILKSGINLYGREGVQTEYEKSLLFKYLNNREIRWDKRWIKKHLKKLIDSKVLPAGFLANGSILNEPNDCCDFIMNVNDDEGYNGWLENKDVDYDYRFGRAMLGLAEHYEFRAKDRYIYKVSVKNDNGFERFKAPVTFKIYGTHLFAICIPIPENLYDEEFSFEVQVKQKQGDKIVDIGKPIVFKDKGEKIDILKTPNNSDEFKLDEFLIEFFDGVGFQQLLTSNINQL